MSPQAVGEPTDQGMQSSSSRGCVDPGRWPTGLVQTELDGYLAGARETSEIYNHTAQRPDQAR